MKKKILFISHEASLTGAPLVLLYFMEWLREHYPNKFELGIIHLREGELASRFNAAADLVYKIDSKQKSLVYRIANRLSGDQLSKAAGTPLQKCINEITKEGFDIIYANTAVTVDLATKIKQNSKHNPKLVAHIHELNVGLKTYIKTPDQVIPYIDKIIAVSHLVKANIVREWHIDEDKIEVVYEFSKLNKQESRKKEMVKGFTVGGSGTVFWRKGYDLFVQVARYIKENYPGQKMQFVWVGSIGEKERLIIDEDLKKLDLVDSVHFVGQQKNPHQYFSDFDIFLMTSKEDPFPLVCIEVGMMGKPIICFDKATGIQEIIKDGGGKIVPYLNIEKMSQAVLSYYNNIEQLKTDGLMVKDLFSNFSPKDKCPEIFSVLSEL